DGAVIHLALNSDGVVDLTPLRALRGLQRLNLDGNNREKGYNAKVSDLSPLRGLPLKALYLHSARMTDLSPLHDMPLEELYIDHTAVRDLSPLRGMRLQYLDCSQCPVRDLSVLRGLPLKGLRCDIEPSRDAVVLRSIKSLQTVNGKFVAEFWKTVDAKIVEAADCLARGWDRAQAGKWADAEAEFQK